MSSYETTRCKICGSSKLEALDPTVRCLRCKVLLYHPHPTEPPAPVHGNQVKARYVRWYERSSFLNHLNYTHAVRFTLKPEWTHQNLCILDYGGGGGQFAFVLKSHFMHADVYIVDAEDDALLDAWSSANYQIRFTNFEQHPQKYDAIFLNDVYEHLENPVGTLRLLASKLNPRGRTFIDTPRQFWLFTALRWTAKRSLYRKLLRGTVSRAHLQIWSDKAFHRTVGDAGLRVARLQIESQFTMPSQYYLDNMGVKSPSIRLAASFFYRNVRYLARNKIYAVLEHNCKSQSARGQQR